MKRKAMTKSLRGSGVRRKSMLFSPISKNPSSRSKVAKKSPPQRRESLRKTSLRLTARRESSLFNLRKTSLLHQNKKKRRASMIQASYIQNNELRQEFLEEGMEEENGDHADNVMPHHEWDYFAADREYRK